MGEKNKETFQKNIMTLFGTIPIWVDKGSFICMNRLLTKHLLPLSMALIIVIAVESYLTKKTLPRIANDFNRTQST